MSAEMPANAVAESLETRLATLLLKFEATWHNRLLDESVAKLAGWPGDERQTGLLKLVQVDLELQWRDGRTVVVEDYLQRWPELAERESSLAELMLSECELRRERGETNAIEELSRRFPKLSEEFIRRVREIDAIETPNSVRSLASTVIGRNEPPLISAVPRARRELSGTFGRYTVIRALGRGGMGGVWLARDERMGRLVALKIPEFDEATAAPVLARFEREVRAAAALEHPHICRVYDFDALNGVHFMTMEFVDGPSLSDWARGRTRTFEEVSALIRRVAQAVESAHQHGLIHRDLKPANILLDANGSPKVADFGLAKWLHQEDEQLTQTGVTPGTPMYMSPEQWEQDLDHIGPASDVFSLGVILYELLSGRRPFDAVGGPANVAIYTRMKSTRPTPLVELRKDLPAIWDELCSKMLAIDPEQRISSMTEFLRCLDAMDSHQPLAKVSEVTPRVRLVSTPTASAVPSRRVGRVPHWKVASGVLMVLALVSFTAWWVHNHAPRLGHDEDSQMTPAQKSSSSVSSATASSAFDSGLITGSTPGLSNPEDLTVQTGDRGVAAWVLQAGGQVTIEVDLEQRYVAPGSPLPDKEFRLINVDLHYPARLKNSDLTRLRGLEHLQVLDLYYSPVSDEGIKAIGLMPSLTRLHLERTDVTDTAMPFIAEFSNIEQLILSDSLVTERGILKLRLLKKLKWLDITHLPWSESVMSLLAAWPDLQTLSVSRQWIRPDVVAAWTTHPSLCELQIRGDLTIEQLELLRPLKKLTQLGFVHNHAINAELLRSLILFPKLACIVFFRSPLQPGTLRELHSLPRLKSLNLSHTPYTDEHLAALHGLENLEELYVAGTQVTSDGIAKFKAALPRCRVRSDVPEQSAPPTK